MYFFFLLTFCVFSVTFYIFMLIISLFLVIIVNFSIVCLLIFVLTYLSGLSFAFTIYLLSRDSFPLLYILFVRAFCLFVCLFFPLKEDPLRFLCKFCVDELSIFFYFLRSFKNLSFILNDNPAV